MELEKIGRYKIKEQLGRGGMATVFRAEDPRFGRAVAVKVLPRAFLHDDLFRARFTREAKTIAALEHGAIVPVYDFGEEDSQPYIVMRLMSGGSLADKLEQGPFSIDEAMKIVSQLAPALDAAHGNGIIHRDMKPANILFDQYDNAYLSDFGIARVMQASHTLTGENVLGTPAYMSPEQVQGDKEIDGRCDLYALGIIFYQMLVGNVPYQATTPAKVMMMHVLDPIPNLSLTGLDLPPLVERWFSKAMAKDPEKRFATATEMFDALENAMQGHEHHTLQAKAIRPVGEKVVSEGATVVRQPHTLGMKSKRAKKPFLVGAVVVGSILVLAVVAMGFWGWQGGGPLSMLAPDSPTSVTTSLLTAEIEPTNTELPPTEIIVTPTLTLAPVATQTSAPIASAPTATFSPSPTAVTAPETLVVGGADKIAFFNAGDVWVVDIDGINLQQLTFDGAEKHDLSWAPDGEFLFYISGKCIWKLALESGELDYTACFETARFLEAFVISPDGEQVAISLNRELFLVPFDEDRLREARYHTDLREMSECDAFSPWLTAADTARAVKEIRWSNDMNHIAVLMLSAQSGIQGDIIKILDISNCDNQPNLLDEFPIPRFEVADYKASPYLENFAYNGRYLYALTSFTRNDGYGYLYFYNADLHRAELEVDPIGGGCCYRDASFSPDGRYVIFAYQPFDIGAKAQLYYILYASIGTGASYDPIPLPEDFFSDTKAKPQPVLRPVVDG